MEASRREDKRDRRRRQRLEQERQASRAERRRRGRRAVIGLAVFAVVITGVVLMVGSPRFQTITTGLFGKRAEPSPSTAFTPVPIPKRHIANLATAARAAKCVLRSYRAFGRGHTVDPVRYRTNPPTSGDHSPVPAADGPYAPDNVPSVTQTVHALEHGRVAIQYRRGASQHQIGQLKRLFDEKPDHMLLFQNQTGMPYVVAATAWRHLLACPRVTPATFDAIRAFRAAYIDNGPERVG